MVHPVYLIFKPNNTDSTTNKADHRNITNMRTDIRKYLHETSVSNKEFFNDTDMKVFSRKLSVSNSLVMYVLVSKQQN